jgi:hypothetical protein
MNLMLRKGHGNNAFVVKLGFMNRSAMKRLRLLSKK